MLQFSTTIYTVAGRFILRPTWRATSSLTTSLSFSPYSNIANEKQVNNSWKDEGKVVVQNSVQAKETDINQSKTNHKRTVATEVQDANIQISKSIDSAKTVNELLNLVKMPDISKENILKIMSNVTNLANQGINEVSSLEKDKRFQNLQKMLLGTKSGMNNNGLSHSELENMSQYSIPTMISEMAKLAEEKNRNLPILKFYAYNIIEYGNVLSPKSCSQLLYTMAILSFPEVGLLEKITNDLNSCKKQIYGSVFNSIVKSVGMLRYKNGKLLDLLCDITLDIKSPKPTYLNSVANTLAVIGYKSEKTETVIEDLLLPLKLGELDKSEWINYVWSLLVLDKVTESHLVAVLGTKFLESQSRNMNIGKMLKLQNINAAAQYLFPNYTGPLLPASSKVFDVDILCSEDKKSLLQALSETLTDVFGPSSNCVLNVITKMGFRIDAVCYVDSNFDPVPSNEISTRQDTIKLAILLHHFNDYTRGEKTYPGVHNLKMRLLKATNYRVLNISYEYLSPEDKVVKRSKYLKEHINSLKDRPTT